MMTDPNYWLAAWLAGTAIFLSAPVIAGIEKKDAGLTITGALFCLGTALAALYCAGFVVMMP